jgi:hypothetical protein
MTPPTEPQPGDTIASFTRDDAQQLVLYFGGCLPPAIGGTADDRARRDNAALGQVAAMQPANADEISLAARCVAAAAHADDQLRQLRLHAANYDRTRQINAQYALMVRTSGGARSLLLRVQTARRRLEMDAAACAQGAVLAAGLLALLLGTRAALGDRIEVEVEAAATAAAAEAEAEAARVAAAAEAKVVAAAKAAAARVAAAAEARLAAGAPQAAQRQAWQEAPLEPPAPLSEEEQEREKWHIAADKFATIFPLRTRLIRRFGKLPDDCGVEQPEPKLLEAIRTGDRYSLIWADGLSKAEVYINAGKDRHLCKYEDGDEGGDVAVVPEAIVPEPAVPG